MDSADEENRVLVSGLNPHLLCSLCCGYMIEASTIVECLHSFCKSCIFKYLESNKHCPICDVQIHKTKPHLNIKSDKTLQTLIYKLVPNLLKSELQRRQEFFDANPDIDGSSLSILLPTEHHHIVDRYKFLKSFKDQSTWISLCVRPITCFQKATSIDTLESCFKEASMVRYFSCPQEVRIIHLKKLIREKFELDESVQIEMLHGDESLKDYMTMKMVTEEHDWDRKNPFEMDYSIKIVPDKERALKAARLARHSEPAFKDRMRKRLIQFQEKSKELVELHGKSRMQKRKIGTVRPLGREDSWCQAEKKARLNVEEGPEDALFEGSSSMIEESLVVQALSMVEGSSPMLALFDTESSPIKSLPLSRKRQQSPPSPLEAPAETRPKVTFYEGEDLYPMPSLPFSDIVFPGPIESSPLSSPRGPLSRTASAYLSSSPSAGKDCIATEVFMPHKKTPPPAESRGDRNIFDLVRPLLSISSFKSPEREGISSPWTLSFEGSSKFSDICTTPFRVPASQASTATSTDAPAESSLESPENWMMTCSSSSSDTEACPMAVACTFVPRLPEDGETAALLPTVTLPEVDQLAASMGLMATLQESTVPGKPSKGDKSHSSTSLETRSTFFEKFSEGLYFANDKKEERKGQEQDAAASEEVLTSMEVLKPKEVLTPKEVLMPKEVLASNPPKRIFYLKKITPLTMTTAMTTPTTVAKATTATAGNDGNKGQRLQHKVSGRTLKLVPAMATRPGADVCRTSKKGAERKAGFEASCKEGANLGLQSIPPNSRNASARSYKISKREMCGLFMDMSTKYLEEFPANGFALASTLSESGREHGSTHERRSKFKPAFQ